MTKNIEDIQKLEAWLGERLVPLAAHAERVAELIRTGCGTPTAHVAAAIVRSAADVVTAEAPLPTSLKPEKLDLWRALVPALASHARLLVADCPPTAAAGDLLDKEQAARFLGCSVRKLEQYIADRMVTVVKLGAGRTSRVRFRRQDLVALLEKQLVPARSKR